MSIRGYASNKELLFTKRFSLSSLRTSAKKFHFALYARAKRVLGFLLACILLVALSPLFIILSLIIKLDSPGPALFRQKRTGKGGQEFQIYKFRTMYEDNDLHDQKHADRQTRVGVLLRRTSIDELPQLFNIIKGEMAFVGPRPWVPEYYANMNRRERQRFRVLPGITGLAQVNGRNSLTVEQKIRYDLDYIKNYSLVQDVKIIGRTFGTVFKHESYDAGKDCIYSELNTLETRRTIATSKRNV